MRRRDARRLGLEVRRHHCRQAETRTAWPSVRWHLDEVFVSINGKHNCTSGVPWTAKARFAQIPVEPRREIRKAALKLDELRRSMALLQPPSCHKPPSYRDSALRELGLARRQDTGRWKNNRADIRSAPANNAERRMKRLKSPGSAQRFLAPTPPSTMCSTSNAILSPAKPCAHFALRRC